MKPMIVTTSWDDGHQLDLKLAGLLSQYGLKGTFYVAPEDREFTAAERLTPAQIRTLAQTFEIGAHTITHPRLTQVPNAEADREIEQSKVVLEALIGRPVTTFCYPGGAYNAEHVEMVRAAGYRYARTVDRFGFAVGQNSLAAPTTAHAYRHWSDAWNIARFARFNPITALSYLLNWDRLAIALFNEAARTGSTFHLWGHSWEIAGHHDWQRLERVFKHIAGRQGDGVRYLTNGELV